MRRWTKSAAWPAANILPWGSGCGVLCAWRGPARPEATPERKLKAIRKAATYSYPTADIEQMLDEIERGYLE